MTCLTRKLQQNLARHIKKHYQSETGKPPAELKDQLVSKGVCPSDVTEDQINEIVKIASR